MSDNCVSDISANLQHLSAETGLLLHEAVSCLREMDEEAAKVEVLREEEQHDAARIEMEVAQLDSAARDNNDIVESAATPTHDLPSSAEETQNSLSSGSDNLPAEPLQDNRSQDNHLRDGGGHLAESFIPGESPLIHRARLAYGMMSLATFFASTLCTFF